MQSGRVWLPFDVLNATFLTLRRPFLRASLEKTPEEGMDELVITLELSREAKRLLEELIRKWLVDRLETEEMARYISPKKKAGNQRKTQKNSNPIQQKALN